MAMGNGQEALATIQEHVPILRGYAPACDAVLRLKKSVLGVITTRACLENCLFICTRLLGLFSLTTVSIH